LLVILQAMTFRTRPATSDDREFLFTLHKISMRRYVEQIWGWDDLDQRQRLRSRYDPELLPMEIVVVNDQDAGCLIVERRNEELYLHYLVLLPSVQGQGIGSRIMVGLLQHADHVHLPLRLSVLAVNPARALYERLGFRIVEEDEVRIHMEVLPSLAS
jgi:GNAT superfamily N-acetyltransferase